MTVHPDFRPWDFDFNRELSQVELDNFDEFMAYEKPEVFIKKIDMLKAYEEIKDYILSL